MGNGVSSGPSFGHMGSATLVRVLAITSLLASLCSGEQLKKASIGWSLDTQKQVYTNHETKISFPKAITGFRLERAEPVKKEGDASFSYWQKKGLVALYLTHRGIAGFPGRDDCAPAVRDGFAKVMRESYGKTDFDQSFRLQYRGKAGNFRGVGTTLHFTSFRNTGSPAYSEIGVVLIGDFLFYYRATFPEKEGLKDLAAFLAAMGMKKI
jgi:hypothetical protein